MNGKNIYNFPFFLSWNVFFFGSFWAGMFWITHSLVNFSEQSTVKKMVKRTRTKIIKGSFNCDCQSLLVNLLLAHKLLGNSSLSIARNFCILCSGSLLRCALYFTLYIYTLTSWLIAQIKASNIHSCSLWIKYES